MFFLLVVTPPPVSTQLLDTTLFRAYRCVVRITGASRLRSTVCLSLVSEDVLFVSVFLVQCFINFMYVLLLYFSLSCCLSADLFVFYLYLLFVLFLFMSSFLFGTYLFLYLFCF